MADTKLERAAGANKADKPRIIVVREFSGQCSMREAFEQAIENHAGEQFLRWKESKTG